MASGGFPWCLPFWFCVRGAAPSTRDTWVSLLQDALKDKRRVHISEELREVLLWDEQDDFSSLVDDEDNNPLFLLKGLPRRPLYVELGHRLYTLYCCQIEDIPLLLPAEHFGLSEYPVETGTSLALAMIPDDPPTKHSMNDWINNAGTRGILYMLGMRSTIGTDPRNLLPPSWTDLLEAAARPHKEKSALSVAARARSKHAHRGKDQFFGTVMGPQGKQNVETQEILVKLLLNAAWINIHTFGGNDGEPFLEVRVASGYGARWKADWTRNGLRPHNVSFRGFLEPQMPDGHERKWRH